MPKVSIIVPIFNVEKYLKECLDSLVNQTLQDIEIVCIHDGSPDNCPELCDEYAEKYNNITVIHKENGGLSDARNFGIDKVNDHQDIKYKDARRKRRKPVIELLHQRNNDQYTDQQQYKYDRCPAEQDTADSRYFIHQFCHFDIFILFHKDTSVIFSYNVTIFIFFYIINSSVGKYITIIFNNIITNT